MNAFKRKLSLANEEAAKQKMAKVENETNPSINSTAVTLPENTTSTTITTTTVTGAADAVIPDNELKISENPSSVETIPAEDKHNDKVTTEKTAAAHIQNQSVANVIIEDNMNSPLRRGSQESAVTTTTQTTTTTGTDSTSSSSSDSSSSDTSSSDSEDSSSEDEANKVIYLNLRYDQSGI